MKDNKKTSVYIRLIEYLFDNHKLDANYFRKWTKDGIIAKIFESFAPNKQTTTQI